MMTFVISIVVLNVTCAIVSYLSGNWMMGFVVGFFTGLAVLAVLGF